MADDFSLNVGCGLSKAARKIIPFVRPTDSVFELGSGASIVAVPAAKKFASASSTPPFSGVQVVENWTAIHGVDVGVCHHVLEYLQDPFENLTRLMQVLRPGGKLVVFALYDPAFRRPRLDQPANHFYSWNVQTLGNLLVDCGYNFESGETLRAENDAPAGRKEGRLSLPSRFFPWLSSGHEVRVVVTRPA